MMSAAVFNDLLKEFQDLWDELGERPFHLIWHNISGHTMQLSGSPLCGAGQITEWLGPSKENPPFDLAKRVVVARLCMPLDNQFKACTLGSDVVTLTSQESLKHARDEFKQLSSKAGSSLPPNIRDPLNGFVYTLNTDPAVWWYALLFYVASEGISCEQSGEIQCSREITVYQPLLSSVDAIGRLGLNTDHPEWPSKTAAKTPKQRGRSKAEYRDVQRDAQLATDWAKANGIGVFKTDFAKAQGMSLKEFNKLLNRVYQRKKRSDK